MCHGGGKERCSRFAPSRTSLRMNKSADDMPIGVLDPVLRVHMDSYQASCCSRSERLVGKEIVVWINRNNDFV